MKEYCRVALEIFVVNEFDVITASTDPGTPDYDFYPGIDGQ